MGDRVYSTGIVPATAQHLRDLAEQIERWRRDKYAEARELEARICAALLSHDGWEYLPPRPYEPAVKVGRKIVKRESFGTGPRIHRHWTTPGDGRGYGGSVGSEEVAAPNVLTQMGLAWGLLHGRVLIHLSDIGADGLPLAHVGGGQEMRSEGKGMATATTPAALVAAILRCEAMERDHG